MDIASQYRMKTGRSCVYNIMPIENIPSVLRNGLLSYHQAEKLNHRSIAMQDVQCRRESVRFKNGLSLHDYASMYFDYNNPMLYKRKDQAEEFCILAISSSVLDLNGCIISDGNGAGKWTRFYPSGIGLDYLDFDKIFAQYWTHNDANETAAHRKQKCAEILVPHSVSANYISSACVLNQNCKQQLFDLGFDRQIVVKPKVFYQTERRD